MSDEMISVGDAAKKLGVSTRTVQRYCKQGLLNHKWVHGKRHRELRIVPPIPLSLLPGVKRGSAVDSSNMVTKEEFADMQTALTLEIVRRDQRIEKLERGLAHISRHGEIIPDSGLSGSGSSESERLERIESILEEYQHVRPVERKLILKLARTVKEQDDFLRTLGMGGPEEVSGE